MIRYPSRPRLTRPRRVNPRFFLFSSCETTVYYKDDEIPEIRVTVTTRRNDQCAKIARRGRLVHSKHCENPSLTSSLHESSDEEEFLTLTAHQPIIKEAQLLSQGVHENSTLQRRKGPELFNFQSLKYCCTVGQCEKSNTASDFESSLPIYFRHIFNDIDSRNTLSELSTDSSFDACYVDNSGTHYRYCLTIPSFSEKNRPLGFRITTVQDEPFPMFLSSEIGFHEDLGRSLSACGLSTLSRKMPRKQSKALKMLSASEGFIFPSMSRPSHHFQCEDFVMRTRKFSMDQVRNLLFEPSGEIRIYRLTNEKFFNISELIDILYDNQYIFFH